RHDRHGVLLFEGTLPEIARVTVWVDAAVPAEEPVTLAERVRGDVLDLAADQGRAALRVRLRVTEREDLCVRAGDPVAAVARRGRGHRGRSRDGHDEAGDGDRRRCPDPRARAELQFRSPPFPL